ncbi:something about silencing, SAS, complex subunit 4-domain-containing protein [Xylariomycetidae sp. FL0641]|nr:something about silencing, SAS, complex subunit 4-domain-containing protein [Xylariomycetidae sp. FL0641]
MASSTRRAEGYPRPHNKPQRRAHQTAPANEAKYAQIIATTPTPSHKTTRASSASLSHSHSHSHSHANSQLQAPPSQAQQQQSLSLSLSAQSPNLHNVLPLYPSANPRMKRPRENADSAAEPLKSKRARITVEILATSPPKSITVKPQLPATTAAQQPPADADTTPLASEPLIANSAPARSSRLPPPAVAPAPSQLSTQPPPASTTATTVDHALTKHREKVINGIRHELDRLQPNAADSSSAKGQTGRKLRSQEATRFKSELSAYFPDYDEVIGNDPKEQHVLSPDTPIFVVDSDEGQQARSLSTDWGRKHDIHSTTVRTYGDDLFTNLNDSQRLDFDFLRMRDGGNSTEDPLPDTYYQPAHKRAERLEKSIRNTERGRAQHERDQIVRLLNDLEGHDWLRTMGVSGVTESRKKTFEPARDHFIKGCQAILEKFRLWSQEEKRRKLEKERALAAEAEEDESDEEEDDEDESDEDEEMAEAEIDDSADENAEDSEPPEYNDADASARQLHAEALARAKYAASSSKRSRGEPPPSKVVEPPVFKEFTSFFAKKHERDAALNKGRRRGRNVVAWGHPIPDMMEWEFDLPEEYRDAETLKAHERQKRRERRHRS